MNFKEFYDKSITKDGNVLEDTGFKIYLDMDGVLCDFVKAYNSLGEAIDLKTHISRQIFWKRIKEHGVFKFYSELDWLPDGKRLWNYVKDKDVTILSSLGEDNPDRQGAQRAKELWLKNNNITIPKIFTPGRKEKQLYAKPNHILIDDDERNIEQWNAAGGIAIHFKTADEAIKQLGEII